MTPEKKLELLEGLLRSISGACLTALEILREEAPPAESITPLPVRRLAYLGDDNPTTSDGGK